VRYILAQKSIHKAPPTGIRSSQLTLPIVLVVVLATVLVIVLVRVLVIALVIVLATLCNCVERCEQTFVLDRCSARSKCILFGRTHVSNVGDSVGDSVGDCVGESVGDCVGDCVGDSLQLRREM
jgi:hypothetical protein